MATITKKDLIEKISLNTEVPRHDVKNVVETLIERIKTEIKDGNRIEIRGFGIFEIRKRKPRVGRNPKKPKNVVIIPARNVIHFKAGKEFKKLIV